MKKKKRHDKFVEFGKSLTFVPTWKGGVNGNTWSDRLREIRSELRKKKYKTTKKKITVRRAMNIKYDLSTNENID